MNVLFISNLFPDRAEPIRGLDNATLLNGLVREDGFSVRVIALRPVLPSPFPDARRNVAHQSRAEDEALRPVYVKTPYLPKIGSPFNVPLMVSALREPLRKAVAEADVVLVSWLFPDGCAVQKICAPLGKPVVQICQGSDAHQYLRSSSRRRQIVASCSASHTVITRSGDLGRQLAEHGVPREKLRTVYNGVDLRVFHPGSREEARRALGLPLDRPILLFVGNFLPVKNPLLLLEAWKNLEHDLKKNTTLVMLGAGPLRGEIERYAASHGLSDRLLLPGRLPAAQVAEYQRAADLLCLSSHNEGLPNVILESFASGLPVITTDVGGISEIFRKPELGELVPAGNVKSFTSAISKHLKDSARKTQEIAKWGTAFAWERARHEYGTILSCAASGSRPI